ncbi:hypothetical protein [Flavobacterium sp.]|uniref:hypothetical protein n=1 Tax=Flavobacterium sp. TaxID=239 RepID=UPI00374CA350
MWINLTKEIFEKAEFKSLNFLYQILSWYPSNSNPRYNIIVDTEAVKHTTNFIKLSSIEKNLKEFLDIEFSDFANSHSTISYRISYKVKSGNFNIEESILFFNQPVSIVLENNKNDSQFIIAIIKHFGDIEGINKAEEHLDNGWIQFENAGGCSNISNFIEGFLKKFKVIADKNNKSVSDYFRGIIIIDSDKEFEIQDCKHLELIKKLTILGVESNVHILEKRMMENYLPKDIFEELKGQSSIIKNGDLKDWLDVYLNLTNKGQMDYLNISDGFPPKKDKFDIVGARRNVKQEILNFFSLSITDVNFQKLDKGFKFQGFDKVGNLKSSGSFKEEFPNLFKKSTVNRQNLQVRDGIGELQNIANKISNLL